MCLSSIIPYLVGHVTSRCYSLLEYVVYDELMQGLSSPRRVNTKKMVGG